MTFVGSILGFASCGRAGEDTSYRLRAEVPAPGEGFDQALSQSLGVTLHAGNRATFVNDERVFDALAEDVAWAKSSIHILSYIWKKGTASDSGCTATW